MLRQIRTHLASAFLATAALAGLGAAGCAGADATKAPAKAPLPVDSDAVALLPRGAIAVASLDARAFYSSGGVGAEVAMVTEKMLPLGQDAGFSPARDVDRVVFGVYAGGGLDATAVVTGRFDLARIHASLDARLTTRGGSFVAVPYAGHVLYTSGGLSFIPLTEHTVVAGTELGARRFLDRLVLLRDVHPQRELPDWMLQTLDSPGAAFGAAVDFSGLPPGMFQSLPLPMTWTSGLTNARLIANFHDPGMNVASTLMYVDPPHATAGADSLRQLSAIASAASVIGVAPRMQNLTVVPNGAAVESKFVLDEQAMKTSLQSLLQYMGPGRNHA